MLQDVVGRERSDLGYITIQWFGGDEKSISVTHIFSIAFEDLPKNVDKLVIPHKTPISLHLERLVGLSHENGV